MYDVLKGLGSLVRIKHYRTDSTIFQLHYFMTVILLVAFSILVTCRQYVGSPIHCNKPENVDSDVLNTFCWIQSTFTFPHAHSMKPDEVPHPGIISNFKDGQYEKKYVKYYQWVCFTLFAQAILFYIPRYLWKTWEGGKVEALSAGLDLCLAPDSEEKKNHLVDYLDRNMGNHNWYCIKYFICELLSLVNLVGQLFFLDRFFQGLFFSYGLEVISYIQLVQADQDNRADPLIYVFPRMTKCEFHYFGPSGGKMYFDAICILPLNIINEKVYIFLWFWFFFLLGATLLLGVYRLFIVFSPRFRHYLFKNRFPHVQPQAALDTVLQSSYLGDWFLLYLLGQNINNRDFGDVLRNLAEILGSPSIHPTAPLDSKDRRTD